VSIVVEETLSIRSAPVEAQELLSRVVAGDETAWKEMVDRYAGLVWSVARSYRLSGASTDDVVQTVWLRLAEHCGRIREPDRLASWLATTTRNEALRVIRGNMRLSPQSTIAESAELTAPSVEERVTDDATLKAVLGAFAQLSTEDQQLLRLLCTVPPLDYQTIAEMLGRPIGSIGPTRARCLERLKRLLPPGLDPKEGTDERP
jgi:RNA polymerase sigma factor (sigma-70 family)